MKLVEILAKELKEWPINTDSIWQDYDGELRFFRDRGTSFTGIYLSEICDDCLRERYDSSPVNKVTKYMWEAEKAKLNAQNTSMEAENFNPIYCRDRIKEIDSLVESLEEERVSLVQALEDEGFSLIEKINKQLEDCKQSHEDMSDWNNWKEGDRIQVIKSGMDETEKGDMCTVVRFDKSDANQPIYLENDAAMYHWPVLSAGHFNLLKWHSRPQ